MWTIVRFRRPFVNDMTAGHAVAVQTRRPFVCSSTDGCSTRSVPPFLEWNDESKTAYGQQIAHLIFSGWEKLNNYNEGPELTTTLARNCRWWDDVFATEKTGYRIGILDVEAFRDGFFSEAESHGLTVLHRRQN